MSAYRRRPCTYIPPANPSWTPAEGERIEQHYAPLILDWEIEYDRWQQDYDLDQFIRYSAWRRVAVEGIDYQGLIFMRTLISSGRLGRDDDHAD